MINGVLTFMFHHDIQVERPNNHFTLGWSYLWPTVGSGCSYNTDNHIYVDHWIMSDLMWTGSKASQSRCSCDDHLTAKTGQRTTLSLPTLHYQANYLPVRNFSFYLIALSRWRTVICGPPKKWPENNNFDVIQAARYLPLFGRFGR